MLAWEGRVTTLWAWASSNTRPAAASRSSSGVSTRRLPAKPRASARRVSMVIRTTSAPSREGAAAFSAGPPWHAAATAASARSGRRRMKGVLLQLLEELLGVLGELAVGLELEKLLEVRLGLRVLRLVEEDHGAVVVGVREARVAGDHLVELLQGGVHLAFVEGLDADVEPD